MARLSPPFTAEPGTEEFERVICASLATSTVAVYEQMERIRESALRRNPELGVHAVLLYQSGWFVLWAEGPAKTVRKLMARVGRDKRHHTPIVVHHSRGVRCLPTVWSMMLSPSAEPADVFGLRVAALRDALTHGTQFAPTSVIRRLSAPMQLPQAQALADPEAFHRVGVCAADANPAFDLVRWLARHHGEPTERRRFAGEDDLDSGSDYVEFMHEGSPCRVIAVSRKGLLHGVRRAFLPDWPHLLLLFSGNPLRDETLMDRVREACQGLPASPTLLGVAPDAATHTNTARQATYARLTYLPLGVMAADDPKAIWEAVSRQLQRVGTPTSSAWSVLESSLEA